MAERKNPKLDAQHQAILKRMMQLPENKSCADCKGPYPRWASTNLGIFICMTCSGIHRKLGTHLSQVRSITLDTWTAGQIAHFQKLGNSKAEKYFEACLPDDFRRPHSSDSMRMESFIRDKYEHRRFITVENGGLGGGQCANASRGTSSLFTSSASSLRDYGNNNRNIMGNVRPRQNNQFQSNNTPYDDSSTGAARMNTSYAGRFSSTTTTSPIGRQQQHNAKPNVNVKNPVARASTLKELVNMGFATDLSLRAVEASGGDLQRAIDWVLQHSSNSPPRSRSSSSATTKPKQPPKKEIDLLDFSDDPTPAASAPTLPSGGIPSKSTSSVPISAAAAKSKVDDFADFGEFESALPSSSSSTPNTNTNSLSSSLADLYKRPAYSSASVSSITKTTTPTKSHATAQPNINSALNSSPHGQTASNQPALRKPSTGLASINLNVVSSTSTVAPSSASLSTPPTASNISTSPGLLPFQRQKQQPNGMQKHNNIPTTAEPPPPPPPPPMQEEALLANEGGPPPPSPPDMSADEGQIPPPPPAPPTTTTAADANGDEKEEVTSQGGVEKNTKVEDEDPFAALSMMALSSATASRKKRPSPKATAIKSVVDLVDDTSNGNTETNAAKTTSANVGLDALDDLMM